MVDTVPKRRKRRGPRGQGYISYSKARERWRASIPLGKGRSLTKYFVDADQAEAWKAEQIAYRDAPDVSLDESQQNVADALLALIDERDYLRVASKRAYILYARHITQAIGAKAVADVTPQDVGKMDKAHGLLYSRSMCESILTLLDMLYRKLIALRVVTFNPVSAYRTITPRRARKGSPAREPVALDYGMCRLVLKQLDDDPYQAFITWLMITGLRAGELRGLRVVNVRDGLAHIAEQMIETDRFEPAPLKTADSTRIIPIPTQLLLLTPIPRDGLLFPHEDGGALPPTAMRRHFRLACQRAKMPVVHPHDLRHTAASGMIRLGMSDHYAAALLGHAPSSMTRHYARPDAEALRPWVEQWANLVLGEAKMRKTGT